MITMVTIMPSLNKIRSPAHHHGKAVSNPEELYLVAAETVTECLRNLEAAGVDLVLDQVELSVRFG